MKKINFILKKNKKEIISYFNINAINNNDQLYYIIDNIKYNYQKNIFKKESKEEKIILDFNKNICTITIQKKYTLNLNITHNNIKKSDNKIIISYKVETEKDILNEIIIEYV